MLEDMLRRFHVAWCEAMWQRRWEAAGRRHSLPHIAGTAKAKDRIHNSRVKPASFAQQLRPQHHFCGPSITFAEKTANTTIAEHLALAHRVPPRDAAAEAEHPVAGGALKGLILARSTLPHVWPLQQAAAVPVGAIDPEGGVNGVLCHEQLINLEGQLGQDMGLCYFELTKVRSSREEVAAG